MADAKECKTLVLCGGKGTRLNELGQTRPKALVELDGTPILFHKLRHGVMQGFTRFIIAIGYQGEKIIEAFKTTDLDAEVEFSDSGVEAGMLRRIYDSRDRFGDRVIVTYGDSLANIELPRLLDLHRSKKSLLTIVSAPIQSPFGLVTSDQDRRVMTLAEKPVLHYYIGTFVMEKEALSYAPPQIVDRPDGGGLVAFFKILMAIDRLYTYVHEGPDITFNTIEELDQAQDHFLKFYTHFQK